MLTIGFDAKRYFLNRSGLGNYSRDLVRMLATNFPDQRYILYSPKLSEFASVVPKGVEVRVPSSKMDRLIPNVWRSKTIANDLRKDDVSLFHGLAGELPQGLKRKNIKTIVTIHDLIYLRYPELYKPIDRFIYNQKSKYAVQNADCIIAISQQTKEDIIQYYRIPEDRIQVIYQGCHPAFKQNFTAAEIKEFKQRLNLPEEYLLNVGTIEPRKNAFQIVKAIKDMDIPLVIVGRSTPYVAGIKEYLVKHNMEDRVIFLSGMSMSELALIYAGARIFIYPSKFEGFGIPIIEALYAGIPVISNKFGVFPEAGGPASAYIDPENIDELSDTIQKVLGSEELREKMITEGKAYVQKFDDQVIAQQLMECYSAL